jgi:hypothetical protein
MKQKRFLLLVSVFSALSFFLPLSSIHGCYASTVHTPPVQGKISVKIDTTKRQLYVYANKKLFEVFPVALGKPTTPTPIGEWIIITKQKDWGSGFGSRWLGLNVPWGIYGIHGTNKPYSIGYYASGGCIRMQNSDIEQIYSIVKIGTPVIILGDPLNPLRNLAAGAAGADVRIVQLRLQHLGYFHDTCNGRFELSTENALKKFQEKNGLPVNGVITWQVYHKLGLLHSRSKKNASMN